MLNWIILVLPRSLHPSYEVTDNEYRFDLNLTIKTLGLHRYLVKYIYSTLSHVLAFTFFCVFCSFFFTSSLTRRDDRKNVCVQ